MSTPAASAAPPDTPDTAPAAGAVVAAAVPAAGAPRCENCGAGVAGRYCGNCGQRLDPPLHSLRHFLAVALEDVTHADSRLWRTLAALLFKPGYLTREFLGGRRARYLPPVRLYLVLSVVFFLWAAATHSQPAAVTFSTSDHGVPQATRVVPLTEATPIPGIPGARAGESVEERNRRECGYIVNYDGPWAATLRPAMHTACLKIRADPRSLYEGLWHNLPRAMFLFLPLIAALMMLMYWRPRHYYVEHLLLLLHNHACVFLLLPLAWVVKMLLPFAAGPIDLAVFLYLAWYVYRSMRSVYGQGRALTLAKLTVLAFFYFVFGLTLFVVSFLYSALMLA